MSEEEPEDRDEFSVCQFFPDGTHEYVCRFSRQRRQLKRPCQPKQV